MRRGVEFSRRLLQSSKCNSNLQPVPFSCRGHGKIEVCGRFKVAHPSGLESCKITKRVGLQLILEGQRILPQMQHPKVG